jgi:ribonuclease-3
MSGRRNDGDGAEAADPAGLRYALCVPITDETLERALTHRSYAYENGGLPTNERLEFLGDSVLSLVVTDTLYKGHPTLPEGQLAKLRAAVVQMSTLAEVAARELNLGSFVRLGRGEEGTGGRDKPSILADTLEAVIGATYIDCGLDEASGLVHRLFDPVIERSALLGAGLDWKTSLQELTADRSLGVPVVKVGARDLGEGEGRSKKAAEQLAAEAAYLSITANDVAEKAEDQPQPDPERSAATPEPSAESVKGARATPPAPDPSASPVNAALQDSVPPQPGSADAVDA